MAISVTFNGTSYSIPSPGQAEWADSLNAFLVAIAGAAAKASTQTMTITVAAGIPLTLQGVVNSPSAAVLRLVPQDAQPLGPNAVGAIYVTTAGVLKICTVAGTPGTWVSAGAQT